jgi:hypothetical protein
MKSSHPPSPASWLLEHLVPEGRNEVLAGDLAEEFGQRGSASWYWRQVLAAIIVGFLQEIRVRWTAVLFAIVFSIAVPWRDILFAPKLQSLFFIGIRLPWPLSLISQIGFLALFDGILLALAVGVYLAVIRNSNPHKLTQALLVGLFVVAVSSAGAFCAPALHRFSLRLVILFNVFLPLFSGFLVSMWIVAPSVARTNLKKSPAQNAAKSW